MNSIISRKAGGDVHPSRFVIADTTADGQALEAGAGGIILGISQEGVRRAPWTPLDDGLAAIAGEDLKIYVENSECLLELGGTVTRGDRIKATTAGKGVATTTNLDEYGAVADQSGVSGNLIKVRVTPYRQVSAA